MRSEDVWIFPKLIKKLRVRYDFEVESVSQIEDKNCSLILNERK